MVNFLARYVNMSIAEVSCHLIPCIYLIPCILILIPCIRFNWFFKSELKTRDLFLNEQDPNKNTKKSILFQFSIFSLVSVSKSLISPFSPRCRGCLCCGRLRRGAAVCHENVARRPQHGAAGSAAKRWSYPEIWRQGSHGGRSMKVHEDKIYRCILV